MKETTLKNHLTVENNLSKINTKKMKNKTKIAALSLALGLLISGGIGLNSNSLNPADLSARIFNEFGNAAPQSGTALNSDQTVINTVEIDLDFCEEESNHSHTYSNVTTPEEGHESWARATEFRIYLHEDFMASIDLDNLWCSDGQGGWIEDCSGTSTANGGTSVELILGDLGDTPASDSLGDNYAQWSYGLTDPYSSPEIAGYNDYDQDGSIDATDADRILGETINFFFDPTLAIPSASATTSSAVWIKFHDYDIEEEEWTEVEEDGEIDYHWNNHTDLAVSNYTCEEEEDPIICDELFITPGQLFVDPNLIGDTTFELTAFDLAKNDITADLDFVWEAFDYTGATSSNGQFTDSSSTANPLTSSDSQVDYSGVRPADRIYVYAVGFEDDCNQEVIFPYCQELNVTDPTNFPVTTTGTEISFDIEIEVLSNDTGSGQENWEGFEAVDYTHYGQQFSSNDNISGTFTDSTNNPLNPLLSRDWNIVYEANEYGTYTVTISADPEWDVYGNCTESFEYELIAPACTEVDLVDPAWYIDQAGNKELLDFNNTTDLEIMYNDISEFCFDWTADFSDGSHGGVLMAQLSDGIGTLTVDSSFTVSDWTDTDPNPTVTLDDITLGTGTPVTYFGTLCWTGYQEGSTVDLFLNGEELLCSDTVTLPSLDPYCEDTTLSAPYYDDNGTQTTLDLTDSDDIDTIYDDISEFCYDWQVDLTDGSHTPDLIATVSDGTAQLMVDGIFSVTTQVDGGVSPLVTLDDISYTGLPVTYTGTLCWTGYTEGATVDLYVDGEDLLCSESQTLPTRVHACEELELGEPYFDDTGSDIYLDFSNPDDVETIYNYITDFCMDWEVTFSDGSHTGNLIAEVSHGEVELDLDFGYTVTTDYDRDFLSASITLDDTSYAGAPVTYTGVICWYDYEEESTLNLYMDGEEEICSDELILPPPLSEEPYCEDTTLSEPYYDDAGTPTPLDLNDPANLDIIYDDITEFCYDWEVDFTDASHTGTLFAEVSDGSITLDVDSSFTLGSYTSSGASASLLLDDTSTAGSPITYFGTLCWTGYTEGATLDLYMDGEELFCSETVTLPFRDYCEDTTLSAPYYDDAGTPTPLDLNDPADLDIIYDDITEFCYDWEVDFTDASHTGTLIAEVSDGTVDLTVDSSFILGSYISSGASASLLLDDLLTTGSPITYFGTLCWTGYVEGATLDLYVDSEEFLCSETVTLPFRDYCEDTTLSDPYYDDNGTQTTLDLNDPNDLDIIYDDITEFCYDWTVDFTDASHTGTLFAEVSDGTVDLTVDSSFILGSYISSGASASLLLDDLLTTGSPITYFGTLCWTGYTEGSTLSFYVDSELIICSEFITLPVRDLFCEDSTLSDPYYDDGSGTNVTLDLSLEADIDTLYDDITEVCYDWNFTFSDSSHTGTLIGEVSSGSIDLEVDSSFILAGPYSATGSSVSLPLNDSTNPGPITYFGTVCWTGYTEGAIMNLYIDGETELCSESVTLPTRNTGGGGGGSGDDDDSGGGGGIAQACSDADLRDGDGQGIESSDLTVGSDFDFCVDISSIIPNQELEITYSCSQGCIEYDANGDGTVDQTDPEEYSCDGSLTVTNIDGSSYECGTLTNMCEGADISISINGQEEGDLCYDAIIQEDPGVCEEIIFDDPTFTPGEDHETCVQIDSSITDDQILVVDYTGCGDDACIEVDLNGDGEIDADTETFCGDEEFIQELTEQFQTGDDTYEVCMEFTNTCTDADISATIEGQTCEDEIDPLDLGTFDKFIFTFNFSVEKSAYSDDDIFFTHDEDRVFYTLEYEPSDSLTEDSITIRDEMWEDLSIGIEGNLGSGETGGNVLLATSKDELTGGESYTYSLITNMGFGTDGANGNLYEENSANIAGQNADYTGATVDTLINDGYVYIPYIKYEETTDLGVTTEAQESEVIPACEYEKVLDDEGNETGEEEMSSTELCHDPNYSPDALTQEERQVVFHNVSETPENASIRVRYVGVVESGLDCSDSEDDCLTEEFRNTATVILYEGTQELEAEARLINLCSYLVTRNAGDVFLEIPLTGGSDIACIFSDEDYEYTDDYRNVDALIITPPSDTETTSSSSVDLFNTYFGSTASVCDDSESNVASNVSSYICEIVIEVTSLWRGADIEANTIGRISGAALNANTNQTPDTNEFYSAETASTWTQLTGVLTNQSNSNSGILYFDGEQSLAGSLTLGDLVIAEDSGAGAYTIVVENADLILDGDVDYASTIDPTNPPSVAFVVTGGDIIVTGNAYSLVGVYYTDQAFTVPEGTERSAVNQPLEIYGSVYGYLQPLLDAANYVGSPLLDEGGISVFYSSLILLNTPPLLNEFVDVQTEKAVN
jgi:hypothetical protein